MKKYIIFCCIFINLFMIIFCTVLSLSFKQALTAEHDRLYQEATDCNRYSKIRAELYRREMLEQYNTYPTLNQYNLFGGGSFTVLEEKDAGVSLPKEDEIIARYDQEKDEIQTISLFENGKYILTVTKCELNALKMRLKNELIVYSLGALGVLALFLTVLGLVIYFHQRKLNKAMLEVSQGNYEYRIKGEFSPQFNTMAESVNSNVVAANEAARAQRDFVSNFSHELKTPLTAIIGYADLLRSAELDSYDTFTAASYIFSEGKRLEALSLKLMDMIVLDNHEFPLRPLPAGKLLQHIAITVRPMLSENQLDLEFHAAAARIEGERDLLITLIVNLLDNARKASEEGGKVILRGTVEGYRYRISVKDFGRGIPPEELTRITEAFYMVDKSRARAQHGAGLGLALCQKIAGMHGSSLEFKSVVGEGTEVSFTVKKLPKTKEVSDSDKKESE